MSKRQLTSDEKEDILRALVPVHPDPNFQPSKGSDVVTDRDNNFVIENVRKQISIQLDYIEIYPDLIPKLKEEIVRQYSLSFVSPGEMVGCIAATSIGEGQTQDSLNSFHASGSMKENLSSGLTRFKELIDLTHQIKTPAINIEFNPKYGNLLEKSNPDSLRFIREIIHTQLIHIRLNDLIVSTAIEENPRREWWYNTFNLLYSDAHKSCSHRLKIQLDKSKLFKCKKDMAWVAARIEKHAKLKGMMHIAFSDNYTAQLDIWLDPTNLTDCDEILMKKDIDPEDIDKMLRYINSENKAEICLRNVVLPTVRLIDISGLSGITNCYPSDPNDKTKPIYTCSTRGGSLRDVLALDCVNPSKCRSNNVHEVYEIFGIEATFRFLIDEFRLVSDKVSRRHLDVMVEWMCTTGRLSSVNRHGQDISKIGPMAKASFEQPLDAFVKAASNAQTEVITGVSASISTGNLARIGTGSFQLMLDIEKLMQSTPIVEQGLESIEDVDAEPELEDNFATIDEQRDEMTYAYDDDDDGLI